MSVLSYGCTTWILLEIYWDIALYFHIYIYQTLLQVQNVTQGQFKAKFSGFEFSFASPWLVAIPRLNSTACPTILSIMITITPQAPSFSLTKHSKCFYRLKRHLALNSNHNHIYIYIYTKVSWKVYRLIKILS